MNATTKYSGQRFALEPKLLTQLTRIEPWRAISSLIAVWVAIGMTVLAFRYAIPAGLRPWAYLPIGFFMAGRMGALLQLIHEASHNLLHSNREKNLWIARWFCAYPLGVMIDGYITGHRRHHAWTGTEKDPPADTEKYRITDARNPALYALLAKDFFGITALAIFFKYGQSDNETSQKSDGPSIWVKLGSMAIVQAAVLLGLFGGSLTYYLLLWAIPAASFHMVLMRVRGIAEHGLARQLGVDVDNVGQGTFYTRSFLSSANRYKFLPLIWVEQTLIGSFSVHYHHEHHLFPNVPFYNLERLHQAVVVKVKKQNPHIYAKGYFAAALFNVLTKAPSAKADLEMESA